MGRPDSSPKPMPAQLPDHWMARIFAELRNTYGVAFDRQWECPPGQDPAAFAAGLRNHWARELRAYGQDHTHAALRWALDNLPPAPPNLVQFKALCRSAPRQQTQAISYTPDREKAMAAIAQVGKAVEALRRGNAAQGRKWASKLLERQRQGLRLTHDQKQALIAAGAMEPTDPPEQRT